jgi:hypothetical protein
MWLSAIKLFFVTALGLGDFRRRTSGKADKTQVMLDWRLIRPAYKEIS